MNPEDVARSFHESYESLAPKYSYKTRDASAVPWEEVPAQNKELMTATVKDVINKLYSDGWRIVRLTDYCGCDRVVGEIERDVNKGEAVWYEYEIIITYKTIHGQSNLIVSVEGTGGDKSIFLVDPYHRHKGVKMTHIISAIYCKERPKVSIMTHIPTTWPKYIVNKVAGPFTHAEVVERMGYSIESMNDVK